MNTFLRSCIIACASFGALYAADTVKVLEKEINLGKDPKTNDKLVIKAFTFLKNNEKENQDTRWYAVFPYEKELVFYCTQGGQSDVFSVNAVVTATETSVVEFDLADKEFRPKTVESGKKATSLFTMKLTLSAEIQIYKEFVILLAKADKKALQSFVNKHSIEAIEEISNNAILSRGELLIAADDKETCEKIREGKIKLSKPMQMTGKYVFLPAREVIEALLAEAKEQDAQAQ